MSLLSNKKWFSFNFMRMNQRIWMKLPLSNDTGNSLAQCSGLLLGNFCQFSRYCPCLATKMVFVPYPENKLMDLEKTSYIEVFHFAHEIVFSGVFHKQHLWFGDKMYYLLPHQTYPSLLNVLLLHIGGAFCSTCKGLLEPWNRTKLQQYKCSLIKVVTVDLNTYSSR